jgi:hypothetical protein
MGQSNKNKPAEKPADKANNKPPTNPSAGTAPQQTGDLPPNNPATPAPQQLPGADESSAVMLELPLRHTGGYVPRGVEVLPRRAMQQYRDLADGLAREGATMTSGKPVVDVRDALIWLAEQMACGRVGLRPDGNADADTELAQTAA